MENDTPGSGPARDRVRVILGLGGNVGDVAARMDEVVRRLEALSEVRVSSRYRSEPMYVTDQAPFLNAAVAFRTSMDPLAILRMVKGWEVELGRVERDRNGPREIDIDVLDYGGRVVQLEALSIPHPRIAERSFVLLPLREIAPDYRDPLSGRSVEDMVAALPTYHGTVILSDEK